MKLKKKYLIMTFIMAMFLVFAKGGMVSAAGYTDGKITEVKSFGCKGTDNRNDHSKVTTLYLNKIYPELDASTAITKIKVRVKKLNYESIGCIKVKFGGSEANSNFDFTTTYSPDITIIADRTSLDSIQDQWYEYEYSCNPDNNEHIGNRMLKVILGYPEKQGSLVQWTAEILEVNYRKYEIDCISSFTPENYISFTVNKPVPNLDVGLLVYNTITKTYIAGHDLSSSGLIYPPQSCANVPDGTSFVDSDVTPGKTYIYTVSYVIGHQYYNNDFGSKGIESINMPKQTLQAPTFELIASKQATLKVIKVIVNVPFEDMIYGALSGIEQDGVQIDSLSNLNESATTDYFVVAEKKYIDNSANPSPYSGYTYIRGLFKNNTVTCKAIAITDSNNTKLPLLFKIIDYPTLTDIATVTFR